MALLLLTAPLAAGFSGEDRTPNAPDEALDLATSFGQAIIGFDTGMLPAVLPGQSLGGLEVRKVEPRIDYLVVAAETLGEVRRAVADVPGVDYIEDDQILHSLAVPNDSRYNDQYGPALMGAHTAWNSGYGDSGPIVAVLDTGIRRTHEDFDSNRILAGYDYSNNDNNPNDDCEHGTHVSGTVGATTNNGKGVAGMSQPRILPMKVLSPSLLSCSGSLSDINQAIMDSADQGADIISMSLGGGGFSSSGNNAVNYAWNKGVLVVAAAGNGGSSNGVDYPGAYDNAIAVASVTSSKARSSFSDAGPQVEIAAPGSDVISTSDSSDSAYTTMSGTSMATPHVAGGLALALSCDPTLTNVQLRSLMQSTAEDLGSSGRDDVFGYGLMRVDTLLSTIGTCGGGGGNNPPTASFTASTSGLTVSVDASGSSDPDNDPLTYAWTFGDGSSGSGVTASHTYAASGTYTVTLTVNDGNGGSDSTSQSVTVSSGGGGGTCSSDPDPSTSNVQNGVSTSVSVSSGSWSHFKICVGAGATSLNVEIDGPGCGLLGCSFDADLFVRQSARATSSNYDCKSESSNSDEVCTIGNPAEAWWYIGVYGYSGSGTVTLTATHNGGSPPTNNAPTASFTHSTSGLTASFDASGSSDPDGDSLTYSWNFGDGSNGSGVTASHTYASAGTYTVTLTVNDGNGGTDSTSASVTVTAPPSGCGSDPDPATPNLVSGQSESVAVSSGAWDHFKICVSAGSTLDVDMSGPSCSILSCPVDADLYVRKGAKPTTSSYDCRPYISGNSESCSLTAASTDWYYVSVHGYSGSGTVTLTATT